MSLNEKQNNQIKVSWLDLSKIGVYLCPFLFNDITYLLLFDRDLIFSRKTNASNTQNYLYGVLETNGFEVVELPKPNSQKYLYRCELTSLDSSFLTDSLCLPPNVILQADTTLSEIQDVFYRAIKDSLNVNINAYLKSWGLIGYNQNDLPVLQTVFGRVCLDRVSDKNLLVYSSYKAESPENPQTEFLRAYNLNELIQCLSSTVLTAIENKKNIDFLEVRRLCSIFFQPENEVISTRYLMPHHYLWCFNALSVLLEKYFYETQVDENLLKNKNKDSSPQIKKTIFEDYETYYKLFKSHLLLPNFLKGLPISKILEHKVIDAPISFIMQKLLICEYTGLPNDGKHIEGEESNVENTRANQCVLNPMSGIGSLSMLISYYGFNTYQCDNNRVHEDLKDLFIQPLKLKNSRLNTVTPFENNHFLSDMDSTKADFTIINNGLKHIKYVISQPSLYLLDAYLKFSDEYGEFITNRSDLVVLLRSLLVRTNYGRSVFLLTFTKQDILILNQLLEFLASRYRIEGIAFLNSYLISGSLGDINSVILVIGDRRIYNPENVFQVDSESIRDIIIHNYEDLWYWCDCILYKRSQQSEVYREAYSTIFSEETKTSESELDVNIELKTHSPSKLTAVEKAAKNLDNFKPTSIESNFKDSNSSQGFDHKGNRNLSWNGISKFTAKSVTEKIQTKVLEDQVQTQKDLDEHNTKLEKILLEDSKKQEDIQSQEKLYQEEKTRSEKTFSKLINQNTFEIATSESIKKLDFDFKVNSLVRSTNTCLHLDDKTNVSTAIQNEQYNASQKLWDYINNLTTSQDKESLEVKFYAKSHNLQLSIEVLVSFYLGLPKPEWLRSSFSASQIQAIALATVQFKNGYSFASLAPHFLQDDIVAGSLLLIYSRLGKNLIYIYQSLQSLQRLDETIQKLINELELSQKLTFSDYSKTKNVLNHNTVYALAEKDCFNLTYPTYLKFKEICFNTKTFLVYDFSTSIELNHFSKDLIKANKVAYFRIDKLQPSPGTVSLFRTFFTKIEFNRYFKDQPCHIDPLMIHLLKSRLVETGKLTEFFPNYSDLVVGYNGFEEDNERIANVRFIQQQYTIVLQKLLNTVNSYYKEQNSSPEKNIYIYSQKVLEWLNHYFSMMLTIPKIEESLTHQEKPILIIPSIIDYLLFDILSDHKLNDSDITLFDIHTNIKDLERKIELSSTNDKEPLHEKLAENLRIQVTIITTALLKRQKDSNSDVHDDLIYEPNLSDIIFLILDCILEKNSNFSEHQDFKILEAQIKALPTISIFPVDTLFFKKSILDQKHIRIGEVSSRYLMLKKVDEIWKIKPVSPYIVLKNQDILSINHSEEIESFNLGFSHILLLELKQHKYYELAAVKNNAISSDHLRKRIVYLPDVSINISDFLSLVTMVYTKDQFVAPEFRLTALNTPVTQHFLQILCDELANFNIQNNLLNIELQSPNINILQSEKGEKALQEYVSLNPYLMQILKYLNKQKLNLRTLLNHLIFLPRKIQDDVCYNLEISLQNYLKNQKIQHNSLNYFHVTPKAFSRSLEFEQGYFRYLDPVPEKLTSTGIKLGLVDGKPRFKEFGYIKLNMKNLSLKKVNSVAKQHLILQKQNIIQVINELRQKENPNTSKIDHTTVHEVKLSKLLLEYNRFLKNHLIDTYLYLILHAISNGYNQIDLSNLKNIKIANLKEYLRISNNKISFIKDLDFLHKVIFSLNMPDLLNKFKEACQILSFFEAYQLTSKRIEDFPNSNETEKLSSLIPLSITAPFFDQRFYSRECFFMRIQIPLSLELMLSSKNFEMIVAYPNKTRLSSISLQYALFNQDLLGNQSVLSNFSNSTKNNILACYNQTAKDFILAQRGLNSQNNVPIERFTLLTDYDELQENRLLDAFDISQKESSKVQTRTIITITHDLLENYILLGNKFSLTYMSYIDHQGLLRNGLAFSPTVTKSQIQDYLNQRISISQVKKLYKKYSNHPDLKIVFIEFLSLYTKIVISNLNDKDFLIEIKGEMSVIDNQVKNSKLFSFASQVGNSSKRDLDKEQQTSFDIDAIDDVIEVKNQQQIQPEEDVFSLDLNATQYSYMNGMSFIKLTIPIDYLEVFIASIKDIKEYSSAIFKVQQI